MIESITWYLNNIKETLLKFQEYIYIYIYMVPVKMFLFFIFYFNFNGASKDV